MTPVGATVVLALLYAAGVVRVWRRRQAFARVKAGFFGLGIACLLVAFLSPLEGDFARHMAQHLLIGDLAPLCLVLGLTGPILRPVLAVRWLRSLRALAHPFVALPLWAVDLGVWHTAPLFDAALRSGPVHAVEHLCFFVSGLALWAALLELLPGPRWFRTPHRLAYLGVMWLVSLTLSQIFIWSSHPFYDYPSLNDQRIGGGIMLAEGSLVMLGVLVWVLWRDLLREDADVVALPL